MKKIIFLLLEILLFISVSISFAQEKIDFKIGDTVYVNAYYGGCVRATVLKSDLKYWVHIETGTYKDSDLYYNEKRLSECEQKKTSPQNQEQKQPNETPQTQETVGDMKVGDRVDVYLMGGKEGKNRGTIIAVDEAQYKVHFDGCADYWDSKVNTTLVKPATILDEDSPEIKFLIGRWAMTTVGISSSAVAWGKSDGIQINGDGTYVWFQGAKKPPVKGKWESHAKIPNTTYGTEINDGLLIKDAKGNLWKMFRRKSPLDNGDHITIRLMCSGETEIGSRAK